MLLKITNVQKGSLGEEIGFEKGDCLVAFDNNQIVDILDYMYYDAQTVFSMKVLTKSGNTMWTKNGTGIFQKHQETISSMSPPPTEKAILSPLKAFL